MKQRHLSGCSLLLRAKEDNKRSQLAKGELKLCIVSCQLDINLESPGKRRIRSQKLLNDWDLTIQGVCSKFICLLRVLVVVVVLKSSGITNMFFQVICSTHEETETHSGKAYFKPY